MKAERCRSLAPLTFHQSIAISSQVGVARNAIELNTQVTCGDILECKSSTIESGAKRWRPRFEAEEVAKNLLEVNFHTARKRVPIPE